MPRPGCRRQARQGATQRVRQLLPDRHPAAQDSRTACSVRATGPASGSRQTRASHALVQKRPVARVTGGSQEQRNRPCAPGSPSDAHGRDAVQGAASIGGHAGHQPPADSLVSIKTSRLACDAHRRDAKVGLLTNWAPSTCKPRLRERVRLLASCKHAPVVFQVATA